MMRSMYSAISGLKAHQEMLDVVANNIANINTVGFKAQRTSFMDALSQTLQSASGPTSGNLGGTNAEQIGLGVQVGSIDNLMQSGATENTGGPLDVAIQGDGFFRVATYDQGTSTFGPSFYTRAGNFTRDQNGYLETTDGYYVIGQKVNSSTGALLTPGTDNPTPIQIPSTAETVTIGQNGDVVTTDSSGTQTYQGCISLAKFPNDAGLERFSDNKWIQSANSGSPTNGTPLDSNGFGSLIPGSVEMSNVDLAQEFTNMITAQRGFEANSRTITTADQMLQDLVNLKQ